MILELPIALAVAVLLLLFPGLHFVRRVEWESEDLLEVLGTGCLVSVAFWATVIWFVPCGFLIETAAAIIFVAVAAFIVRWCRRSSTLRSKIRVRRRTLLLLLVLLISVGARVGVVAVRAPPSAGDLTMHAYMVELLVIHDGLPASHEPLLPVSSFGENSPGLHAFAALLSIASGLPAHASALLVGALALVLLSLSIDRLLREVWPGAPRTPRALAAFATVFLARNPQLYLTWGGVPTLLSQALAFYLLAECSSLLRQRDVIRSLRAGLIAAGATLTHLIPTLTAVYVLVGLVALMLLRRRSRISLRAVATNGFVAVISSGLLVARFVRLRGLSADQTTVDWARDWIRLELVRSHDLVQRLAEPLGLPPDLTWYLALPLHVFVFLGFLSVALVAWWLIRSTRRREAPAAVVWTLIATLVILHCASIGEFLPYWMALYPSRIHVFLLLPVACALTELFVLLGKRRPLVWATGIVVIAGVALESREMGPDGDANHGGVFLDGLIRTYSDTVNSRVTADDLFVLEWIRSRTDPEAVIANNEGDGGHLIPAMCHRKIAKPHYQQFWYRDEMERWRAAAMPDYVFVGSAPSPAFVRIYEAAALAGRSDLELVLRSGESCLYRFVHENVP